MFVFTLLVIGLLLLAFRSTRLAGVAGLTLLLLVHPKLFFALLILGGVVLIVYYFKRRKEMHFQNCLTDAIDALSNMDIPEDIFGQVVMSHACLLAGLDPDEVIGYYAD